jgi:hypothetical protein
MFKMLLAVTGAAVVLGGCASHSHSLTEGSAPEFIKGEFIHGTPSSLVLTMADRRYVSTGFEVRRDSNMAELARRYRGSDPKHWDRILMGFDRDHEAYSAEPKLTSQDGLVLSCRLAWTAGKSPEGICNDKADKPYQVRFD